MLNAAQSRLSKAAGLTPSSTTPLDGGNISSVVKMGSWVLKTLKPDQPAQMLISEAIGLVRLKVNGCRIPHVHFASELGLVIKYHSPISPSAVHYDEFAAQLAQLHLRKRVDYGDNAPAFLGPIQLPKIPAQMKWKQAFVQCRLRVVYERALARDSDLRAIDLDALNGVALATEGPCLLHGDLWQGNMLSTQSGLLMVDPGCWIGERAIDVAMMQLFGSLPGTFWGAYFHRYPLPAKIQRLIPLYQLYYALAHVALFGDTYTPLCLRLWQAHLAQRI
jgi:phosphatidylserine decarboxylase